MQVVFHRLNDPRERRGRSSWFCCDSHLYVTQTQDLLANKHLDDVWAPKTLSAPQKPTVGKALVSNITRHKIEANRIWDTLYNALHCAGGEVKVFNQKGKAFRKNIY